MKEEERTTSFHVSAGFLYRCSSSQKKKLFPVFDAGLTIGQFDGTLRLEGVSGIHCYLVLFTSVVICLWDDIRRFAYLLGIYPNRDFYFHQLILYIRRRIGSLILAGFLLMT